MIVGLDSAFPPSPATALKAKAGGVSLWSGYLSTVLYDGGSHLGLYHPWPREGFEYARLCGSPPIAFCSGYDNPTKLKALAAAWDVRLCVDIEGGGLRPDGAWKQAWLDASGAGIYGNYGCHNCRAAFHVLAAYPGSGDVQATWWGATPRPSGPCGWQWAGTHTEFGVSVDRGDYDDWFKGLYGGGGGSMGADVDARQNELLITGVSALVDIKETVGPPAIPTKLDAIKTELDAIKAKVDSLSPGGGTTVDLGPLTAKVDALAATLAKIENALKGA